MYEPFGAAQVEPRGFDLRVMTTLAVLDEHRADLLLEEFARIGRLSKKLSKKRSG
jgi:hypothetical protein